MNFTAISFLVFFLLPIVSAATLEIISPPEAALNENFSVTLISDSLDVSDVKIYIQNSEAKIFSEIFNSEWKNSFYYLPSTFPERVEYTLRAIKSSGNFEICAKLRKSGKTSVTSSKCNPLNIKSRQNSSENKPLEIKNRTEMQEQNKVMKESKNTSISNPSQKYSLFNSMPSLQNDPKKEPILNQQNLVSESEKIVLNSFQKPTISEYTTRQEKLHLTFIYLFPLLVILILILIIFHKI